MPYVNHRWLGGLLTNFQTINQRIRRLHDLERYEAEGQLELLPDARADGRPGRPGQAARQPRRRQGHAARPRRRVRDRPEDRGDRRQRGAPPAHPDHRPGRHQLRPRRDRLRDSRQRRRDPLVRADHPGDRPGRPRGPLGVPRRGGEGAQGSRGTGPGRGRGARQARSRRAGQARGRGTGPESGRGESRRGESGRRKRRRRGGAAARSRDGARADPALRAGWPAADPATRAPSTPTTESVTPISAEPRRAPAGQRAVRPARDGRRERGRCARRPSSRGADRRAPATEHRSPTRRRPSRWPRPRPQTTAPRPRSRRRRQSSNEHTPR